MEIPILKINRKKTVPKRLMVFVMVRLVFSLDVYKRQKYIKGVGNREVFSISLQ